MYMGFMDRALTCKILILYWVLAIMPFAAVGYGIYHSERENIITEVKDNLQNLASLKEKEIERSIDDSKRHLVLLASNPQTMKFADIFSSSRNRVPEYLVSHDSLLENFHRAIDELHFSRMHLLDANTGRIIISSDSSLEGDSRNTEPWFIKGMHKTFISKVFFCPKLGRPSIIIASPVVDKKGSRTIGVLAGQIDLAKLEAIMSEHFGLGKTGETYLVDEQNLLISELRFEPGAVFKKKVFTQGVSRVLQGESGAGLFLDYRKEPAVVAYRWLEDRKIGLLVKIDQAEAFWSIYTLGNTFIYACVIVALALTLMGLLIARIIIRPVKQLLHGAREIGQGNLDYRIKVRSKDELGRLAEAFNDMALKRKNALRKILEEKDRYLQIFNIAPAGILNVDFRTGNFVKANEAACKYLGYTSDELLSLSVENVLSQKSRKKFRNRLNMALKGIELSPNTDYEVVKKDGSLSWVRLSRRYIFEEDHIIGATIVGYGIDKQKRKEEKIRLRNVELKALHSLSTNMRIANNHSELLDIVGEKLCELFDAKDFMTTFIMKDNKYFSVICGRGAWEKVEGLAFPVNQGVSGKVLQTGAPYITRNYANDSVFISLRSDAIISVGPLAVNRRAIMTHLSPKSASKIDPPCAGS